MSLAGSTSANRTFGDASCTVCGGLPGSWHEPKLRVYRLILPPQRKFRSIPLSPSAD